MANNNYELDLLTLPEILKELDDPRLKDFAKEIPVEAGVIDKCISRDKLTNKDIDVLTTLLNYIYEKMDNEQKKSI